MRTFLAFACVLACAAALPAFDAQAFLSGTTQDQYALDPSYASLVPQARSFAVDVDMDAIQKAIAEYEAAMKKQDRLNLAVDFDLAAFQKAYDEFMQGLKEERSSFAFDAEAYQQMLAELAKVTLP